MCGGAEGGQKQLSEEEGTEAVCRELQLVALFRDTAERGEGDAGVVPEDVELWFFGLESLDGGFDGV